MWTSLQFWNYKGNYIDTCWILKTGRECFFMTKSYGYKWFKNWDFTPDENIEILEYEE